MTRRSGRNDWERFIEIIKRGRDAYTDRAADFSGKPFGDPDRQLGETSARFYKRMVKRAVVLLAVAALLFMIAAFSGTDWLIGIALLPLVVSIFILYWTTLPVGGLIDLFRIAVGKNPSFTSAVWTFLAGVVAFGFYAQLFGEYLPVAITCTVAFLTVIVAVGNQLQLIPRMFTWVAVGAVVLTTLMAIGRWSNESEQKEPTGIQREQSRGAQRQLRNANSTYDYLQVYIQAREAGNRHIQEEVISKFCSNPDTERQRRLCVKLPKMSNSQIWDEMGHLKPQRDLQGYELLDEKIRTIKVSVPSHGRTKKIKSGEGNGFRIVSGDEFQNVQVQFSHGPPGTVLEFAEGDENIRYSDWIRFQSLDGEKHYVKLSIHPMGRTDR